MATWVLSTAATVTYFVILFLVIVGMVVAADCISLRLARKDCDHWYPGGIDHCMWCDTPQPAPREPADPGIP